MGEVMPGFDKIALMKYPHLEKINHIHHAGNSSGIVDGAAGLLVVYGAGAPGRPARAGQSVATAGAAAAWSLTCPTASLFSTST